MRGFAHAPTEVNANNTDARSQEVLLSERIVDRISADMQHVCEFGRSNLSKQIRVHLTQLTMRTF